MTNELLGDVTLTLGGRDFVLNFSVHAVTRLEAHFGQPVTEIGARWRKDKTLGFIGAMFWAAILERQPEFDTPASAVGVRLAGELMRLAGGDILPLKVVEAWALSWPIPPAAEDAEPARPQRRPPAVPGTGRGSSASGSKRASARRKSS